MNSFKVANKSKYESLFSLKYSTIFELFQRSTSWHSWPKIEECVGCFVCFNKNNLFFFNPTVLVAPISVLQLKHHNLLEPRASCAKNVQNENSVCGPASNVDGGRGGGVVGGRSYLILEPVWWKPQCAAAALLSFHCCSVARGLGRGAPRRAGSQQQEVKSRCRAFQVITANGYCR